MLLFISLDTPGTGFIFRNKEMQSILLVRLQGLSLRSTVFNVKVTLK